jgi:hypothetical protein
MNFLTAAALGLAAGPRVRAYRAFGVTEAEHRGSGKAGPDEATLNATTSA